MRERLIEALCDPAVYPHPVDRVERNETHISWVLLAGAFAYKIKKPLDLGFLDFTQLERRRFYCEEEVRLNRRTAPALYLGVVAITGSPDAPALGGDGEPIEYAVRMRRFDARKGFDRLLTRGALEPAHIADLAGQFAKLHATAEAICAAGKPSLIDAAFLKRWQRDRLRRMAAARGLNFRIIHCQAPESTLTERIRARERSGDDASEAGLDVLEHQQRTAEPLSDIERGYAIDVDTRRPGALDQAAAALREALPRAPGA